MPGRATRGVAAASPTRVWVTKLYNGKLDPIADSRSRARLAEGGKITMSSPEKDTTFHAPPLSDREYAECFDTFKQISSEWNSTQKWLEEDFLPGRKWNEPLKVLSIGSGTGDFDLQLMRQILNQWRIDSYIAVDPNVDHNRVFMTRFRESGLSVRDFRILPRTFPVENIGRDFDLVHMTHCLYYIPDRLKAIQGALEVLSSQGVLLIFHQTPLGINEVQRRFLKRAKGDEGEMYSSKNIYRLLDSLPVAFKFDMIDGILDVTDFAEPESVKGKRLLNFFLECRADLLPAAFRKEVVTLVGDLAIPDAGRKVLFHPVGVFCVSPRPSAAEPTGSV
jgi:SAM-dependent methyltransferase